TPRKTGYRLTFEIISAKTVACQRSSGPKKKYVSYTILVKRTPGLETHPGLIERRYSDFLSLFINLRKRFPSLLNDFPFPKKTIVGNFSPEVITERSVAFQHLLAFCLSVTELRRTHEFHDFLYFREVKEARRLMKCSQFEDCSNLLENVYFIQEKLLLHDSEFNSSVFRTLCVLTASLNAVNNVNEAQNFAEKALHIAAEEQCINGELYAALIVLAKNLILPSNKLSTNLDSKLMELRQKGVKVDKLPTLLEIVLKKDFTFISL
ncbi:Sorting nexin-21-like protein, partial [Leptotrombidium deliense]